MLQHSEGSKLGWLDWQAQTKSLVTADSDRLTLGTTLDETGSDSSKIYKQKSRTLY